MSVARLCEAAQCQASHPATEDAKEREPNPCREIAIVEEAFGKIWQLPNRGRRKRRVAKHCTCQHGDWAKPVIGCGRRAHDSSSKTR